MQRSDFTTGGFVLHRVEVEGYRYSAWFDAQGALVDAERVYPTGKTCSVAESWHNVRSQLADIGRRQAANRS